jgi:hypothetical protein
MLVFLFFFNTSQGLLLAGDCPTPGLCEGPLTRKQPLKHPFLPLKLKKVGLFSTRSRFSDYIIQKSSPAFRNPSIQRSASSGFAYILA